MSGQGRIHESREILGQAIEVREARPADVPRILALFQRVYQGKYPLDFGSDPRILQAEIADHAHHLWLVAEHAGRGSASDELAGAIMFGIDPENRMGKAAGGVVAPGFRQGGLGTLMLRLGITYLTDRTGALDVIYGTTRTVSQGPSKMVSDAGFHKMGIFPNAVQIETMEHLNLDVFITAKGLEARRRKPYLFSSFYETYNIARRALGLERAYLVTERAPLKLSRHKIALSLVDSEREVIARFRQYKDQKRLSNSFFPFHMPNQILASEDGGTEVFLWHGGVGKQASILGFRSDRVNKHDLLDSVAHALQGRGAAYVELLVDAYDYTLQQEAYTARYIPSAYFPAMKLADDGLRDDYFVLSRTFRLLDFTDSFVTVENFPFLQAYLKCYNELYIQPLQTSGVFQSSPQGAPPSSPARGAGSGGRRKKASDRS